ncbi:MAG TPA: peptide chain release factor N(5)-glutamine methyltransferase [Pyrinomonadaceae bacterium]|nr:peptide chain release factor N(5)-glutamine methyltransferase [Pyrinomonadaceae bacterium]
MLDQYSIADLLHEASQALQAAGVPEARREAGSLLSFVIGKDRTFLISHPEDRIDGTDLDRFREAVARRAEGEPLQYITGVQDFYGREFRVTPDVLIPRPETELLVEAALETIVGVSSPSICDVGTGSGCIAVTLLCERTDARAVAVDVSEAALAIAADNAARHGVAERIELKVSDCFHGLEPITFDLVVSNPPYVSAAALAGLQREVRDHEPLVALSPGADGLIVIRRLLHDGLGFLKPHGHLIMEIGFDQGEKVQELIDPDSWRLVEIRPDLQSIPRIVVVQKLPQL